MACTFKYMSLYGEIQVKGRVFMHTENAHCAKSLAEKYTVVKYVSKWVLRKLV